MIILFRLFGDGDNKWIPTDVFFGLFHPHLFLFCKWHLGGPLLCTCYHEECRGQGLVSQQSPLTANDTWASDIVGGILLHPRAGMDILEVGPGWRPGMKQGGRENAHWNRGWPAH